MSYKTEPMPRPRADFLCDTAGSILSIHVRGEIFGVLDFDSPEFGRFTEVDREGLEAFVRILEEIL